MPEAVNLRELDAYLQQVVQALQKTVSYAIPHAKEPNIAEKAIRDCDEILSVIMAGEVAAWVD
jgi:hypothetical protein